MNEHVTAQTPAEDSRLDWIEPKLEQLQVRDSAHGSNTGLDMDAVAPDCTRS